MAHLSQERVQQLYDAFGELKVLDDIVRHRSTDNPPTPILGYPRFENSVDDYERFTGKQLDEFIDATVKVYLASGLEPDTRATVALLAPSNVDFIVSVFALTRLGYSVLCLSLRIAPLAVINLLKKTDCSTIIHGHSAQVKSTVERVNQDFQIRALKIPIRRQYDRPNSGEAPFVRKYDREEENKRIALILHSSGSTGLPKPIMLSHRAILTHPTQGSGLHNFNALPWYHLYGISTSLQAMWMRKTAHLYNTSLPLTSENLVAVMKVIRPEAIHAVPYCLGLLAEKKSGIDAMRACQVVTAAGARTPDELGDRLVKEGINFGVVFGTTEAGLAGDSMRRAKGDNSWNYLRLYANIRKYVYMNPLGDNLYECVYLKGHPALSTSNSDFPAPGSWHSRDVFSPHPTIPDIWKYVTRIDDRITLVNGEKVLPLPIEGRIREDPLVRESAVVGVDQPIPGLLVFRAKEADHMSNDAYIESIWPSVADANSCAEAFSQITKEMIIPIPSHVEYPQTDKGSIIRAQVYAEFADEIKEMYATLEGKQEGTLILDQVELEDFLMKAFKEAIGVALETPETDFFSAGIDSLKAIQMRRVIQKSLHLNGQVLGQNVVYEYGNARRLAHYIRCLREGESQVHNDESTLMKELIKKYSNFEKQAIITGATGSLGAHTLAQLVAKANVGTVYCLVRGANPRQRVLDSLTERGLQLSSAKEAKIVALTSDLVRSDLGLNPSIIEKMRKEVSLIIHIAWPVNFNISLKSFEPHIGGLNNLIHFSLSVERDGPAQLFFCSSISTASNTRTNAPVPESAVENFAFASNMGYAHSKLVGEHIVRNAARAGAQTYVLRIGQIVGDAENGIWNDKESIPLLIRSALTLKALPAMSQKCSWIPVDTLATAILELSQSLTKSSTLNGVDPRRSDIFYNLVNPKEFSWDDLLEELRAAGLQFETIPFTEWLQKLQKSATLGQENRNPAVKLIEYFKTSYGFDHGVGDKRVRFETKAAERDSATMRSPPDIVKDGYVRKFLRSWMRRWG
ncbi:acetyl-CoA synthetase-like protein [Patellaria atrata CBS 101060]|uniref:Acetyl-CoA synthetase-like protein n=1 Tax=Patellaria atrata CBS 101060 TaxID=1346257 RepID=A0A9P4VKC1_9PEZI|nr:acetyl-CoA synthetase-like protein [Patellaria atrata CBS 101060]